MAQKITRIAQLKTADAFVEHLNKIGASIPFKEKLAATDKTSLGTKITTKAGLSIGNRFCILPMEGWDGTEDGRPTEHTKRRWRHFAISGAKLLWGCEAVAVRPDGRANPNQLLMNQNNLPSFKELYENLKGDHREHFGDDSDLLIGLQLTHSGRFAVPDSDRVRKPSTLYKHSILDEKFHLAADHEPMTDDQIDSLVDDFVQAANLAKEAGFQFVDIKHCHGYLGHEFLSAKKRTGKYGGSLNNRLRFLRNIIEGIKNTSNIQVGVRLSAFDFIPFVKDHHNVGVPKK